MQVQPKRGTKHDSVAAAGQTTARKRTEVDFERIGESEAPSEVDGISVTGSVAWDWVMGPNPVSGLRLSQLRARLTLCRSPIRIPGTKGEAALCL